MRRYSRQEESPFVQSYLDLKAKQQQQASSRFTSSQAFVRNPETDLSRLPALNPITMRRSSSSFASERNTKFRLQNLDERLQELAAEVHNTRLETQETILYARALKDSLAHKEIQLIRQDLRKQARGLERLVHSTISSNEEQFSQIRSDCGELWSQTQHLRSILFEARMRADRLQECMGFKRS